MKKSLAFLVLFLPLPAFATTPFAVDFSGNAVAGTMALGTTTLTAGTVLDLGSNTNSLLLPAGTTGQRPTGVTGMLRYNSTISGVESYYGGAWNMLASVTSPVVTGISSDNYTATGSTAPTIGLYAPAANTVGLSANGSPVIEGTNPASAVDYFLFTGAATANPAAVTIAAAGTDTNIGLTLTPQGSGPVIVTGLGTGTVASTSGTLSTVVPGASFITSGTTYTTPATINANTHFEFTLKGGGGGGGGCNTAGSDGGAGGGGATCILEISGLSPSTAYTIAIGAAGTAGASTPGAGGNGGNTALTIGATTYTAGGGNGGGTCNGSQQGTFGGGATNCTINISGRSGYAASLTGAAMSIGGSCDWGAEGLYSGNASGTGANAAGYCSGASGGVGSPNKAGGTGTPGAMLVRYWN